MSKKEQKAIQKISEIVDIPSVTKEKVANASMKLAEMEDHPDTYLDILVATMNQGQDILGLCRTWGISYGDMFNWLSRDNRRLLRYEAARENRKEANIEIILHELYCIINSDTRELYDADGNMKPPSEWPESVAKAVEAIQVDEKGIKVKLWSKVKAIELLGKHLKMFTDKIEHSGSLTLEDLVDGSRTNSKDTSST